MVYGINTRSAMGNNIALQVGVKILLKNKEGKYLLVRRTMKKYPEIRGRWDIVGGRIAAGKTLLENLGREVKEEVGLEIAGRAELGGEPRLIAAQDIINQDRHVVRLTYFGKAIGQVELDIEENDMYKWYTFAEIKNLDDLDIYFKELLKNGWEPEVV